jgi:predicted permease
MRLDDEPYVIIGVLPASFRIPRVRSELWIPAPNTPRTRSAAARGEHTYQVVGLLRPGSTLAGAQSELGTIADRLARRYPETNQGLTVRVITYYDRIVDPTSQQGASISLVAVALVLLIACANVANLLLTRNTARRRELAIRLAVGARPGRIARQLLTESLALALIGGIAGVLLSLAGIAWFRSVLPADVPGADHVTISGRTLLFALGVTVAAGLAFGLAPALKASSPALAGTLVDGGRTGTTSVHAGRLRNALVVSELALALVLLISAGLLIRAARGLEHVDLGFDPRGVLTFRTALSEKEYPDSARVVGFEDQLRDRLRAMAGVKAVGAVTELPMASGTATYYSVLGEPDRGPGSWPISQSRGITPGYLAAMRIGVARGRDLTAADDANGAPVALVNEAFARRHWPTSNPIGERLRFQSGRIRTIVGVVRDTREFGPDDPPPPIIYVPLAQETYRRITLVVRSGGDLVALADAVQPLVHDLAPHQPIYQVATLAGHVDREIQAELIMARLLTRFGGIALLLATMGVYGVMGYSVAQRTQELGVRRALGAETTEIVRLVAREGARLVGLGTAIGLALALLSTRALSSFLYGVSAFDPVVFVGVPATLIAASVLATVVPARRAIAVDPAVALRND